MEQSNNSEADKTTELPVQAESDPADKPAAQHVVGAWKSLCKKTLVFASIMLALLTVFTLFAGFWKYAELASHFRFQVFVVHLPVIVLALTAKLPKTTILLIVSSLVHAIPLCLLYVPASQPQADQTRIKVLCANVLATNYTDTSRFETLIQRLDPDIVGVVELSIPWEEKLEYLKEEYPYFKHRSAFNGFGIGLYSRYPIEDLEKIVWLDAPWGKVPSLHGTLVVDGQPVHIALVHALSPLEEGRFELRNQQFEQLKKYLAPIEHPILMMGDLNCTTWSPYLRDLIDHLDLNDTRQGRGYQGSWPAVFPPLLIPIDHVLVSDSIVVTERRLESFIGSDHYPVYFEFGVEKK